MGSCIICGTPVEGHICDSHQEDAAFEFRGEHPNQLVPGRYYRGTVDGYADFGLFVDLAPGVTGLLHRSELDRRLESLDHEPGDAIYVQVKNVRDNGNIDLGWSIRQADREFRGVLIQDGTTEKLPAELDETTTDDDSPDRESHDRPTTHPETASEADAVTDASEEPASSEDTTAQPTTSDDAASQATVSDDAASQATVSDDATSQATASDDTTAVEETIEYLDTSVEELSELVGETVRLEGEIVSVRQTGGPTVFELRDETGVIDCAAFVEAGVRAYPEIDVDAIVRLDGEVEKRRGELQVETDELVELDGTERTTVEDRLARALSARARPDSIEPLGSVESVANIEAELLDVAELLRTAILESRPIVVRHPATAEGYVAGAAIERAVLPVIRNEHERSDAEYHYFVRRPLDDPVYGMDAATNDATRMLQDRDRHDEKLPVFLFLGTASTIESEDGLGLLGVYGVDRIVLDAGTVDQGTADLVELLVTTDDDSLSTGSLAADLAAALNDDVREDLRHLPAVSYWEHTPDVYVDLAVEAGYDPDRIASLRAAIALEAYYQSYEDKRELVTDLLFEDGGGLAEHIADQFTEKLEAEYETAIAHLQTETREELTVAMLDTEAYTHRFDFPPTRLLLDEIHRRKRDDDPFVTIGLGLDELFVRSTEPIDLRAIAADAAEAVPTADVTAVGVREGRIEFLSGEREAVADAVVDAIETQLRS